MSSCRRQDVIKRGCTNKKFSAVLFTHFSSIWTKSIVEPVSARKTSAVLFSLALSFISDIAITRGDFRALMPAYVGLITHALSSSGLEHTHGVLSPALGPAFTTAASTLGACALFLPLYMFREVIVSRSLSLYHSALLTFAYYLVKFSHHSSTSPNIAGGPSFARIRASIPLAQHFSISQQCFILPSLLHDLLSLRIRIRMPHRSHRIWPLPQCHRHCCRGVALLRTIPGGHFFVVNTHSDAHSSAHSLVPQNHSVEPRIPQDILLPSPQPSVHGCADVVWCLDQQSRAY